MVPTHPVKEQWAAELVESNVSFFTLDDMPMNG
jgi:hypothetical protein